MINLKNIVVEFESKGKFVRAVDDVSLKIEKGDIYGVVGYSGAGKSTLIRTINLLQRPTSGEVLIHEEDITKISERVLRKKREKIGMIFQHFNLMNSRTVFENVNYALKKSGLSKKERKDKVDNLLKLVDILDKRESYPSQLSGGQKQRVAIARALANDPDILLCDEATSALDPQTTGQILELLKVLNKKLDLTIVIITHQMEVVKDICNKVAIMEGGKLVESGNIFDIFANPKEKTTINFIKTVNHEDEFIDVIKHCDACNNLSPEKRLFKLKYIGDISQNPIIAELYVKYKVISNIIWGNIELIGNKPIGNLAVVIEGEYEKIEKSINYILKIGGKVDEILLTDEGVVRKKYRKENKESSIKFRKKVV